MKKTHIIALFMMIAAAAILVMSSKNFSSFATFEMAAATKSRVKIAGQLSIDDPIVYDPEKNPNHFTFYLVDQAGEKRQVILNEPKPRDFEKSEEIVVTGRLDDQQVFHATEILLKCPSKYAEEKLDLRNQS